MHTCPGIPQRFAWLVTLSIWVAPFPARASEPTPESSRASSRAPTRIDFDDRMIQGQTNKAGSVYLYDRKQLSIPALTKIPENFRGQIEGYLDER
jgi:hypothetical protein